MPRTPPIPVLVTILTVIAVFVVLYIGKGIFAPILSALILAIILTPITELLERIRIPAALAAFLSMLMALSFILVLTLLIEPYITQVINRAPIILNELRVTVEGIKQMLRGVEEISEDVAAAIEPTAQNDPTAQDEEATEPLQLPSLTDALFYAPQFLAQFMIFAGTLYFSLLAKNDIYRWVAKTDAHFGEAELRAAGRQVSRYVLTISAINFGFGVLVTVAMHLLGMPSPVVWGLLAFTVNFVLYLGPIALICMLLVAGIVVFDGAASFLPAAIYMAMNATEAQFVTPTLVGKSLSVNPLMVFLSLVFWFWLWGPIGGIIAIPLLIWGIAIIKGLGQIADTADET